MTVEERIEALNECLFSEEGKGVFAVLDGASVPDLLPHLDTLEPDYVCLYRGDLTPDMEEVAPYLVQVEPGSEFAEWLMAEGWGEHWGIFAASDADLRALRDHFRRFLTVYDSAGKPMLFRYYDPRVLRVYLPTCNDEELAAVFGPVEHYLLEDEDPAVALCFRTASGALRQERLALAGPTAAPGKGA
jgi:hypothetical protein